MAYGIICRHNLAKYSVTKTDSEVSEKDTKSKHGFLVNQIERPGKFLARKGKFFSTNPVAAFMQLLTAIGVTGCVATVLAAVHPSLILRNTTPTGGDMGAHIWWPDYMKNILLPSGRIFGWSMDFYAGFPVGQYYFPVPAIMINILDILFPYNVAFKMVVVSGSVCLPIAAYTLGRALRAYRPIPMLMAFAATAFLFFQGDPRGNSVTTNSLLDVKGAIGNQRIMGGPIVSTMAGEFSFSIALCFALFFLAAFYVMLRDGKYRVLTGVLLALTIMSHLVVAIFVGLAAIVFWGTSYISENHGFDKVSLNTDQLEKRNNKRSIIFGKSFLGYFLRFVIVIGAILFSPGVLIIALVSFPFIIFLGWYLAPTFGFTKVYGYLILSWIIIITYSIGSIGRYFFDNKTENLIYLVFLSTFGLVGFFVYGFIKFRSEAKKILKDILPIVSGLLMSSIWLLPLLDRFSYTSNMRYTKVDDVLTTQVDELYELYIAPKYMFLSVFIPVAVGFILSATLLRKHIIPLILTSTMMATVFALWPEGHAWNLRFLPFWYLCIYFVAVIGMGELVRVPNAILSVVSVRLKKGKEPKYDPVSMYGIGVVIVSIALSQLYKALFHCTAGESILIALMLAIVSVIPYAFSRYVLKNDWRTTFSNVGKVYKISITALLILAFFGYLVGFGTKTLGADGKDSRLLRDRRGPAVDWSRYNFKGYEELPDYKEFKTLMDTMADLPAGRALWETTQSGYGTTLALMLLPYYTNHRISSMEGLYFEASGTTAYHFLNVAEVSKQASNPMAWPKCEKVKDKAGQEVLKDPTCIEQYYGNITDFDRGISHMKLMGVRYYMAHTADAKELAKKSKDLKLVASVPDMPDALTVDQKKSGQKTGGYSAPNGWDVFEIKGFNLVEPLAVDPVVVSDKGDTEDWVQSGNLWLYKWWNSYTQYPVLLDHGPKSFKHMTADDALKGILSTKEQKAKSDVKVSNVKLKNDSISFDVDKVGEPVLVKVSYYPTFEVTGAKEIYRASPNFMVVVPTSKHVELKVERDGIEWFSILLFILSIVLFVFIKIGKFPKLSVKKQKSKDSSDAITAH